MHSSIDLVDEHDPFDLDNQSLRDPVELREKISHPGQEAPDAIGKSADRQSDAALGKEVSLPIGLLQALDVVGKERIEQPENFVAVACLGEPLLEGYEDCVLKEQVRCTVHEFV